MEKNFYDQPINDLMKHCDGVRKVSAKQDGDYTTWCLLYIYYSYIYYIYKNIFIHILYIYIYWIIHVSRTITN